MNAEKRVVRALAAFALICSLSVSAHAQCVTATVGGSWQNATMTSQTGAFTVTFDATPSAHPTNAIVALSNGPQTAYAGFACLVRFNTSGNIDARNGGAYAATSTIPFAANSAYHFRLAGNVTSHTYSIFVTPPGGTELTVGSNFAFRTEQNTVTSLNYWGDFVDSSGSGGAGSVTVCNFSTGGSQVAAPVFSPAPGTYPGTQNVSITSATNGASIRYTTDTSAPSETAGTLYSGPVNISTTTTLKGIAFESGFTDSSITSGTYTISSGSPFTITASAGANGSISPTGNVSVNPGANQTFTFAPNAGFAVSGLVVDGTGLPAASSYTFSNVQANHTISVTFAAVNNCTSETGISNTPLSSAQSGNFVATWDATPSISGINTTMSLCNGSQTAYGSYPCIARFNPTGIIDAYNGTSYAAASSIPFSGGTTYHFEMDVNATAHTYSVYVTPSGGSKTLVGSNYTFRSTAGNPSSLNTFNVDVNGSGSINICNLTAGNGGSGPFTITASAGANGSISPVGAISVNSGASQTFAITPNSGFIVAGVTVDGASVGAVTSYTFSNVTANHTISATFQSSTVMTFTIAASATNGGSINPTGNVIVNQGSSQGFSITANSGFNISSVMVDGVNQGAINSFTFGNVQSNHTISAAFSPVPSFTITASAGSGGSISPSGTITVSQGGNQTFTIAANAGFTISGVTVDGASQGTVASYTFNNVQANHSISASFSGTAGGAWVGTFDGFPGAAWSTAWGVATPPQSDNGAPPGARSINNWGFTAPYTPPNGGITISTDTGPSGHAAAVTYYGAGSSSYSCSCGSAKGGAQFYMELQDTRNGANAGENIGNNPGAGRADLANARVLYLKYYVKFPVGFDFGQAGKLPGFFGGTEGDESGFNTGPNSFSTRYMWRGTAGEVYEYDPAMPSGAAGNDLGSGNWHWQADGKWHSIEQSISITAGSITVWYDGVQVYASGPGVMKGFSSTTPFGGILFSTFYGGHASSWGPKSNTTIEWSDFTIDTKFIP
jgi:hypothetical protein